MCFTSNDILFLQEAWMVGKNDIAHFIDEMTGVRKVEMICSRLEGRYYSKIQTLILWFWSWSRGQDRSGSGNGESVVGREFARRRHNQKWIRSSKDKSGLGATLEMAGGRVEEGYWQPELSPSGSSTSYSSQEEGFWTDNKHVTVLKLCVEGDHALATRQ